MSMSAAQQAVEFPKAGWEQHYIAEMANVR